MSQLALRTVLVALLLTAGCSAPIADDGADRGPSVSVSISNHHDASHAVRVVLATGELAGVQVTYENGSTRTYDVATPSALPPNATRDATDLEPLGADLRPERFDVAPDGGVGTTFEDVAPESRLVYVVSRTGGDPSLLGWGVSRCGVEGARHEFSLTIDPTGALAVSTHCTDETATDG